MDELKDKMKAQAKKILAFDESLMKSVFKNATDEEKKEGREIMANVKRMLDNGDTKGALKYLEIKRNEFSNNNG